jgi:trigger factor
MDEAEPKASVEAVGPLKKRLDVEVPAQAVSSSLDRAFRNLQQRVRLRGFRPGKAPRAVLERLYGQQIRNEVTEQLVRDAYAAALARHRVLAVGAPEIVVEPLGEESVLRFSATVEVRPEITVSDYENIEVTRPHVRVDDEDVDRTLARLADAAATLHPVTDRDEVEAGDVVTANLSATIDGQKVADLSRTDALVQAGQGTFPGALEERLLGLRAGTPSTVDVAYPSDYPNTTVAGRQVTFTVSVTAIARKEVPRVDEEFARTHGRAPSLAALREKIRGELLLDAERQADTMVRRELVDALLERHPFDAPETMVERRCDALLDSLGVQVPPGADRQNMLATLRQELRPRARRDIKAAILLDSLAAEHGLAVGDEELAERIDRIADETGTARGRARSLYATEERHEALREQMLREKALALVVDRSKIRTVQKS